MCHCQIKRGVAAHDADDADRLATAGAGRAAAQGKMGNADLAVLNFVEEAFDQPTVAALEIREEKLATLALDV
jgi:hypothetical protein